MTSTNVRTIVVTKQDKFPRESDQDDLDAVLSELAYVFTTTDGSELYGIIIKEIEKYENIVTEEILDRYGLDEDFLELFTGDDDDDDDDDDKDDNDDDNDDNDVDNDDDDDDDIMKHPCVKELQDVSLKSAIGYGSHQLRGGFLPVRKQVDIAKLLNYDNLATATINNSEIYIHYLSEDRRYIYNFNLSLNFNPSSDEKKVFALVFVLKKVLDKLRVTPQTRNRCPEYCVLL